MSLSSRRVCDGEARAMRKSIVFSILARSSGEGRREGTEGGEGGGGGGGGKGKDGWERGREEEGEWKKWGKGRKLLALSLLLGMGRRKGEGEKRREGWISCCCCC